MSRISLKQICFLFFLEENRFFFELYVFLETQMSVCYGGMGGKKALKHDDTSFFSGRE